MTMHFSPEAHAFAVRYLDELRTCLDELPMDRIAQVADRILEAYRKGQLVVLMGNGGSAATASHIACDLGKTILGNTPGRTRFRVMSLTDNVPGLTAWANDVGYEAVFAEPLQTWIQPEDVVIAISGSGNSPNILEGIRVARSLGAYTIGLLGFEGGEARLLVDLPVVVPRSNYGIVEDLHMVFGHLITAYIRETLQQQETFQTPHGELESAYPGRW